VKLKISSGMSLEEIAKLLKVSHFMSPMPPSSHEGVWDPRAF
jgi:hypothetical protein